MNSLFNPLFLSTIKTPPVGAGSTNLFLTHPCPTFPGFVAPLTIAGSPGIELLHLEKARYWYWNSVKLVSSSKAI